MRHDLRRVGASNYTFRKLVRHALNMLTGFSTLPLQLASLVGFAFTLFGLGYWHTCWGVISSRDTACLASHSWLR